MSLCTQTQFLYVKSVSLFVLLQNKDNDLFFSHCQYNVSESLKVGTLHFKAGISSSPMGNQTKHWLLNIDF